MGQGGSSPVNSLCGGCGVPLITGWTARNNQGMTWVIINHTVTQELFSSEDTKVLGLVVLLDLEIKALHLVVVKWTTASML